MAKASQRQFRFLAVLVTTLGLPSPASAELLVSTIMEPQATPLTCAGPEYSNPATAATFTAKCRACDAEIKSSMANAKGVLAAAKAADGGVNAGTTIATQGFAAASPIEQAAHQGSTNLIASSGGTALNQQAGMASQVSQAMKQCSSKIKSSCTGFGASDMAAANQSAQSCEQAGAQADATSGDKLAKAAEALKAAGQAAQQAMGMMGQGGGGGEGGGEGSGLTASGLDLDSKNSGLSENAAPTKLETTTNAGGSSLESTSPTTGTALGEPPGNASELSSSRSPASAFSPSGSASPGMKGNSSSGGRGETTSASSGNFGGSSGAGSGAGSSDGSASGGASAAGAAAGGPAGGGSGEGEGGGHASEGGGPIRSTLGLQSSGDELNELVNEGGGLVASGATAEDAEMAAQNQGADWEGRPEQSLFSRVKKKISQVSSAKGM